MHEMVLLGIFMYVCLIQIGWMENGDLTEQIAVKVNGPMANAHLHASD